MRKEKVNKTLLVAGMFCLPATTILAHYLKLPDLVYGYLFGMSAGLIILSFLRRPRITG